MTDRSQNTEYRVQNDDLNYLFIWVVTIMAAFILGLLVGGLIGERTTKQFYEMERGRINGYRFDNRTLYRGIYRDDDYGNIGIIEEQQGGRGR
jgi:hypothetical protein